MPSIQNTKLPDCMLPDGAPTCAGYQELHDHAQKLERLLSSIIEKNCAHFYKLNNEWPDGLFEAVSEADELLSEDGQTC